MPFFVLANKRQISIRMYKLFFYVSVTIDLLFLTLECSYTYLAVNCPEHGPRDPLTLSFSDEGNHKLLLRMSKLISIFVGLCSKKI